MIISEKLGYTLTNSSKSLIEDLATHTDIFDGRQDSDKKPKCVVERIGNNVYALYVYGIGVVAQFDYSKMIVSLGYEYGAVTGTWLNKIQKEVKKAGIWKDVKEFTDLSMVSEARGYRLKANSKVLLEQFIRGAAAENGTDDKNNPTFAVVKVSGIDSLVYLDGLNGDDVIISQVDPLGKILMIGEPFDGPSETAIFYLMKLNKQNSYDYFVTTSPIKEPKDIAIIEAMEPHTPMVAVELNDDTDIEDVVRLLEADTHYEADAGMIVVNPSSDVLRLVSSMKGIEGISYLFSQQSQRLDFVRAMGGFTPSMKSKIKAESPYMTSLYRTSLYDRKVEEAYDELKEEEDQDLFLEMLNTSHGRRLLSEAEEGINILDAFTKIKREIMKQRKKTTKISNTARLEIQPVDEFVAQSVSNKRAMLSKKVELATQILEEFSPNFKDFNILSKLGLSVSLVTKSGEKQLLTHSKMMKLAKKQGLVIESADPAQFGEEIKMINNYLKSEIEDHDEFDWDGQTLTITFKDEDADALTYSRKELVDMIDGFPSDDSVNESLSILRAVNESVDKSEEDGQVHIADLKGNMVSISAGEEFRIGKSYQNKEFDDKQKPLQAGGHYRFSKKGDLTIHDGDNTVEIEAKYMDQIFPEDGPVYESKSFKDLESADTEGNDHGDSKLLGQLTDFIMDESNPMHERAELVKKYHQIMGEEEDYDESPEEIVKDFIESMNS